MKITFLGTASMVPTKKRNHTAILLNYKNENILFDCGENTQRQLKMVDYSPTKLTRVLLTHWHGDHILGLPGLIQTLGANNYNKTLEIYGPINTKNFVEAMLKTFFLEDRIKIKVHEIRKPGIFLDTKDFFIEAFFLKHFTPCLAYSFQEKDKLKINLEYTKQFGLKRHPLLGKLQKGEDILYEGKKIKAKNATRLKKGKKVSLIMDTVLCDSCYSAAKDSDLLICEATYSHDLIGKAKEYGHLTSVQAAEIAKKSKVKKLVLTHFSQRYKTITKIKKEAQDIFKDTVCADDFMAIDLF